MKVHDCLLYNLSRCLEFNGKYVNQNPIFSSPHNTHWIEWSSIFLSNDIWHQAQRGCSRFCCEKSASGRQGNIFFTMLVLLTEHIFFFYSTLLFYSFKRQPPKWSYTLKQFVGTSQRIVWMFDHFVGFAL